MKSLLTSSGPVRKVSFPARLGVAILLIGVVIGSPATAFAQNGIEQAGAIERLTKISGSDGSSAVRAPDAPLMFTGQIMASDVSLDTRGQAGQALDQLERVLTQAGGALSRVLRLNVYLAGDEDRPPTEAVIVARFAGALPAVTVVRTPLVVKGAHVAFDAIALVSRTPSEVELTAEGAVMPAGAKVFLSGIPKREGDLPTNVRASMESLHALTRDLGLGKRDMVQIKAFINPISEHEAVRREITKTFDGGPVPPIIMLEWTSPSHAEIEVVLSGRALQPQPQVPLTFPAMPGRPLNPSYSHVACIAAGTPLIFLGGIGADHGGPSREQWKRIFESLGSVLFEAKSSYRHLAKATYYVADPSARATLNDIRTVYYDPSRPAASSAIAVSSVGRLDRAFVVDMIAVPYTDTK